jgi:hypothetical protein
MNNLDKLFALAEEVAEKIETTNESMPESNLDMPVNQANMILTRMLKDMGTLANLSAVLRSKQSDLDSSDSTFTAYDASVSLHKLVSSYVAASKLLKHMK